MTTAVRLGLAGAFALCSAVGCTSSAVNEGDDPAGAAGAGTGGEATEGAALRLTVGPASRTFVELATPVVADVEGVGDDSIAWDVALQGRDVFINGGIS